MLSNYNNDLGDLGMSSVPALMVKIVWRNSVSKSYQCYIAVQVFEARFWGIKCNYSLSTFAQLQHQLA